MAGASAWNSAGTWEERDFSDWSHKKIKERLNAASWKNGDDHLSLTTDNVTGDVRARFPVLESSKQLDSHARVLQAVVLFVKGKKRLGYDLEIKFKWRGQSAGKAITGNGVLKLESDTGGGALLISLDSRVVGGLVCDSPPMLQMWNFH